MKILVSLTAVVIVMTSAFTSVSVAKKSSKIKWSRTSDEKVLDYLLNNNLDIAIKAAENLGKRSSAKSLDGMLQQLLLGHPPKLTLAMIKALGNRRNVKALNTLMFYSRHRSAPLRTASIEALCKLKVAKGSKQYKQINKILLASLRDYSKDVRAKAAWHIGKRKLVAAEDDLLKLFRKGSVAATRALGFIGGIRTAREFAISLENRKARKDVIVNAIGTLLLRKDFGPEPVRVQLIRIIGSINLPGAQTILLKYSGSGPVKFKRSRNLAYKILSSK